MSHDADDTEVESSDETTTDHALIRNWVDEHDGYPAHVVSSEGSGDEGMLRVAFDDVDRPESLKEISWEEFFEEFDEKDLVFAYPEGDPREDEYPPSLLREREGK